MATFRCDEHLANVAAACGFKVRLVGGAFRLADEEQHPFVVELTATGKAARKQRKDLTEAAFILEPDPAHGECCGTLWKRPRAVELAVAVFGLTGESRRLEREAAKRSAASDERTMSEEWHKFVQRSGLTF